MRLPVPEPPPARVCIEPAAHGFRNLPLPQQSIDEFSRSPPRWVRTIACPKFGWGKEHSCIALREAWFNAAAWHQPRWELLNSESHEEARVGFVVRLWSCQEGVSNLNPVVRHPRPRLGRPSWTLLFMEQKGQLWDCFAPLAQLAPKHGSHAFEGATLFVCI